MTRGEWRVNGRRLPRAPSGGPRNDGFKESAALPVMASHPERGESWPGHVVIASHPEQWVCYAYAVLAISSVLAPTLSKGPSGAY